MVGPSESAEAGVGAVVEGPWCTGSLDTRMSGVAGVESGKERSTALVWSPAWGPNPGPNPGATLLHVLHVVVPVPPPLSFGVLPLGFAP